MELTDNIKQKAIDAFIKSMHKSGANKVVGQNMFALDTALTDAVEAVLKDLPEPDLFAEGDRVEIIALDPEDDFEDIRIGLTGTVKIYRANDSETNTCVELDSVFTSRGTRKIMWFYGEKELKKIGA